VGDAQAHTVYVPRAGGDVGAAAADKEETEAEAAGQSPTAVTTEVRAEAHGTAGTEAAQPDSDADAPKRRGLRVRRAAKRPAGPPASHS
ncbi:MAG: hypothetical protein HOW97_42655, partial [Catenulispora sp.]|nr:hypothetical protein [Catenulispora sp.]